MKGLVQWLSFVGVLAALFILGRLDFQVHHPILFLGVILVAAILLVASLPFLTRGQK